MSVEIQTCVWKSGLYGTEMLVMQAIADCADDDGFAYPSVGHLAWKTGLSRSGVQNVLSVFRDAGYLSGVPATAGDASTRYRVVVKKLPTKDPWAKLKGRLPGQSGRPETLPTISAGSPSDPAQITEAPCPNQTPTLPKLDPRNKEEPSRTIKEPSLGTRIPVDFLVTEEMRMWALTRGYPNPDDEFEAFVDYWTAASGGSARKRDWDAAFRTWLRNSERFKGGKQSGRQQPVSAATARNQRNRESLVKSAVAFHSE